MSEWIDEKDFLNNVCRVLVPVILINSLYICLMHVYYLSGLRWISWRNLVNLCRKKYFHRKDEKKNSSEKLKSLWFTPVIVQLNFCVNVWATWMSRQNMSLSLQKKKQSHFISLFWKWTHPSIHSIYSHKITSHLLMPCHTHILFLSSNTIL